jgi:hypothetical protein
MSTGGVVSSPVTARDVLHKRLFVGFEAVKPAITTRWMMIFDSFSPYRTKFLRTHPAKPVTRTALPQASSLVRSVARSAEGL